MAFSEFTRNFELIELNHNPNDFYKFESKRYKDQHIPFINIQLIKTKEMKLTIIKSIRIANHLCNPLNGKYAAV